VNITKDGNLIFPSFAPLTGPETNDKGALLKLILIWPIFFFDYHADAGRLAGEAEMVEEEWSGLFQE
jgi:hypothetical protein